MAAWNPIKFPPLRVPGQELPERTLRFTIRPTPHGLLDEMERVINIHLAKEIEKCIEQVADAPSFRDDQHRITFPATTVFWQNDQMLADVMTKTMEQAAMLVKVCKEMRVSALFRSGIQVLTLRQVGHGYCHERAFVTIDMMPHLPQNQQKDKVVFSKYKTAIGHLLASYSMLSLLGVWQKTTVWTTNYETPKAVVRFTVQRPPTLM